MSKKSIQFGGYAYNALPFIVGGSTDGVKLVGTSFELKGTYNYQSSLLLVHPSGLVKEMWHQFIDELLTSLARKNQPTFTRIVTYDMRNHGDSAELNTEFLSRPFRWRTMASDVLSVVEQLKLNTGHLVGVGNSFSSVSLLVAESDRPGTFNSIIAGDPALFFPYKSLTGGIVKMFLASANRTSSWETREKAREYFSSKPFYKTWHPKVLEDYLEFGLTLTNNASEVKLKCDPKEEVKPMTDFPVQVNIFNVLKKVKCPTLILTGKGPAVILQKKQLEAVLRQIPNSTHTIVPKSDHLPPFQNPKETANIMSKFLVEVHQSTTDIAPSLEQKSFSSKL